MSEFRNRIIKNNQTRKYKVTNSIGVYDIYRHIMKSKWEGIGLKITSHLFYAIIRTLNKFYAELFVLGKDIIFPCRMGKLEARKFKPLIRIKNGKADAHLPIDWNETIKLWEEDEECYKKRTLVKREEKEIFSIRYARENANYNNLCYFEFFPNRQLKVKLKEKIKNNEFDAFSL